ncbi:MAG: hypothetical protein IK145_07325 [Bacteroidales bacterium]|nr:hypothetical protein [Bacteroidales bacterium]
MTNNQIITERETAIVRLAVWYPSKMSPSLLYSLAYPGAFSEAQALRDLPAVASRWWRSKKILECLQAETALYNANKDAVEARIESECIARHDSSGDAMHPLRGVDFSLPENQRAKLNELINGAVDPHDALDAMKLMMSRQQDIAPDQAKKPQVRAYLPLTCSSCPLYMEKRNKI